MSESRFAPFMREALACAERGRWLAAPNPAVGAVLVRDGRIVARGWHAGFGKAHAEVVCLAEAARNGIDPSKCTLVVTLEPCNHHGKTPPCVEAILTAGVRHVVIGMRDVNPAARGGVETLLAAGVTVETGVMEDACRLSMLDFITWQTTERPYVILKMASTLDGHIASRMGKPEAVSSEASREVVMRLRGGVGAAGGAVLVGANTLFIDNPRLTARVEGTEREPLAAMPTRRLPSPEANLNILQQRPADCVFFTTAAQAASPEHRRCAKRACAYMVWNLMSAAQGLDLLQMLHLLREQEQCHYVLCEGGARLATNLLENGLVDDFRLHLAPRVLGDEDAPSLFCGRVCGSMEETLNLCLVSMRNIGGDCHLRYVSGLEAACLQG